MESVASRRRRRRSREFASLSKVIKENETVVAVLTGHVLKDTDYVMKYHNQTLIDPDGAKSRADLRMPRSVLAPPRTRFARYCETIRD